MKRLLHVGLTVLTTALVGAISGLRPAHAAIFGQQEVDQSKLIAVAAPRGNTGAYQLLILEQTSAQRPCWAENGTRPTIVDPLLLTFNFTGICDRKTDSNGFSIRMGGEDLALNYNLRVVRTTNDLVLIGYPSRDRNAPIIEIGRAYGVVPGEFAKIILNPNWRFAKRTFGEKTLGHVYLTTDMSLAEMAASTTPPALPTAASSLEMAAPPTPSVSPSALEAGETVEVGTPPVVREGEMSSPSMAAPPAAVETPGTTLTEGVSNGAQPSAPTIEVETTIDAATSDPGSTGENTPLPAIAVETETTGVTTVESAVTSPASTAATDPLQVPKSDQEFVVPTRDAVPTLW